MAALKTTPAGRMAMQMVGAFADFAGRAQRADQGPGWMLLGRRAYRRTPAKAIASASGEIRRMVPKSGKAAADAARLFKIHPATVSRLLARTYAK